MAVVYLGQYQDLTERLNEVNGILDRRYAEVLGQDRAYRVAEAAKRLLKPESFFDRIAQFNAFCSTNFSPDMPSKLGFALSANPKSDKYGIIEKQKIRTTPFFYISELSVKSGGSAQFTDDISAPIVHEWNHFVYYVLQRYPIFIVSRFLGGYTMDSFQKKLVQEISMGGDYPQAGMQSAFSSALYHDFYEKTTRLLDKHILASLGIDVPLHWRGKKREVIGIENPRTGNIVYIPDENTDPFYDIPDEVVIEKMFSWEAFIRPKMGDKVIRHMQTENLLASVSNLKVTRVPLDEFLQLQARKK